MIAAIGFGSPCFKSTQSFTSTGCKVTLVALEWILIGAGCALYFSGVGVIPAAVCWGAPLIIEVGAITYELCSKSCKKGKSNEDYLQCRTLLFRYCEELKSENRILNRISWSTYESQSLLKSIGKVQLVIFLVEDWKDLPKSSEGQRLYTLCMRLSGILDKLSPLLNYEDIWTDRGIEIFKMTSQTIDQLLDEILAFNP